MKIKPDAPIITIILLFVGLTLSATSYAEQNASSIESAAIQVLIDPSHEITVAEILNQNDLGWQSNQQKTPSFGFSPHTYWFRFAIPKSKHDWILSLDYGLLDHITYYRVSKQTILEQVNTGDKLRFSKRPIQSRAFLFPVPKSDETQEIILKIRSTSSIQAPLVLWPDKTFFEHDQYRLVEHGAYYGIALVMAWYNFFLFLRLRDKAYLIYVLYVLDFSLSQLSISGFSYQLLWPDWTDWNERSLAVTVPLAGVFLTAFMSIFLKLREFHPKLYRLVSLQICICLLFAVLGCVLPYAVMIPYITALALFTSSSLLVISFYITFTKNYSYAAYLSAAFSFFLAGAFVLAMNKLGFIPRTWFTESAAQIGSAIEIILLSFALAERLREASNQRLRSETETRRVSEQLVSTQKKQNEVLEDRVTERTQALSMALDKVNVLNDELTELSTKDQLTGIRNRRYFDEMLDREFRRGRRTKKNLSLIMIDLDYFKTVNDNYGHLVGDLCLKTVAQTIYDMVRRPPDSVCRYGGEELAIVLPETSFEGARHLAERIRQQVEDLELHVEDQLIKITLSIGVSSLVPNIGMKSNYIIELADAALYKAKHKGRNQVQSGM